MKSNYIFVLAGMFCLALTMGGQTQPVKDEIPKDFKLEMERTPCFGSCPVYTVSVDAKGKVTYKGYKHVYRGALNEKWLEKKKWKISKEQVKELSAAIYAAGLFTMGGVFDDKEIGCKFWGTDAPGVKLEVNYGGKRLSINHYLGCYICQDYHEDNNKVIELNKKTDKLIEKSEIDTICKPYVEHDRKVKRLLELEAAIDRILEYKEHVNNEDD